MRWAIIPVFPNDFGRATQLTREWLQRVGDAVSEYFMRQSGGRVAMSCTALDWQRLSISSQEWIDAGFLVGRQTCTALAAKGVLRKEDFDHFVLLIDDGLSTGGVTPRVAPETSLIGALSATPTLFAHELAHRFGAGHTFLEKPQGNQEYGGPFCLMGGEGGKYSHSVESLIALNINVPRAQTASGPGLCFPNLVATGWADPGVHALSIAADASGEFSTVIELPALAGAPPPGEPKASACIITLGDRYVLEYRSPTTQDDAGVPKQEATTQGHLVIYRSAPTGPLVPLQVATIGVYPGAVLPLGASAPRKQLAEAIGGGPISPLTVTVLRTDPASRIVSVRIEARKMKFPQFERTDDLFDFMKWAIVGREFLGEDRLNIIPLLRNLAELHHLDLERRLAGPRNAAALTQVLQTKLATLEHLARGIGSSELGSGDLGASPGPPRDVA